ncbi:UDP-glucose 4-epimerase GalE [Allostreptomyces psammosilenae]|uniref:UDP-glucose 4-epimerase n=1 Tax=Allostreptomyces psammosilenae TaxID=1892865 RepID=A0A852ZZV0_9ACTN|nr:UDP-glucose 4-epimerase GalE [Allostreptomyces psammosilenae]NYI07367.1 UDP-glucose 4-epimerase [Allostreptomyces psammosilenae]
MTWLVTGGTGYIGSHVVRAMTTAGEEVVVLDDATTGRDERLEPDVPLVHGSVLDRPLLDRVLRSYRVTGVVHIAARKRVAESVERPLFYYRENVHGMQTLLEAVVDAEVRRFVFSSSAAVYGMPDVDLVTEDTPCAPVNPYGETKLVGEWMVRDTAAAHVVAYANLRYFNVAGAATPELADVGESNLVPMMFRRIAAGEPPVIFGDDYPTPDGTCVRDFIHVADVASAHLAAARRLRADPATALTLNIGRGEGVSVREMSRLIVQVTGRPDLEPVVAPRRPGDPARVVASADLIAKELNWAARHGLREMVASAWEGRRLHG